MIVGSILLALGLDAWWDGVQERRLELEYVERLKADLIADTTRFSVGMRQIGEKTEVLGDLLDPNSISMLTRDPRETMRRLNLSSYWGVNETRSAAFSEMEGSGRLILLRETTLRDDLATYYAFHGLISSVMDESFGRYRHVLTSSLPGELWEDYRLDPTSVDVTKLERGLRALLARPEFESAVNAELAYASATMLWHTNLKRRATRLLEELSEAYPGE